VVPEVEALRLPDRVRPCIATAAQSVFLLQSLEQSRASVRAMRLRRRTHQRVQPFQLR
jgi:hypothetical protein